MTDDQLIILKQKLADDFVPHLPPLLVQNKPAEHLVTKNVSRAYAGFAIQKISKLDEVTAAKAVVDDYEDNGIDAIHYHQASKTLFLVQAKLKANEPFNQDEANAFTKGVRDLLNQRYDRFNKNVEDRQADLNVALDEADQIVLAVAHTAPLISDHAKAVLNQFLADPDKPDERLRDTWVDFGPSQTVEELLAQHAVAPVNDELVIYGCQRIDAPRVTYYGQVSVAALASLYTKHGNGLLEKNIRYFLGIGPSDVNRAIHGTLEKAPQSFFYLSNGVTAIAHTIDIKGPKDGGRRFEVKGLSVINGAQTIASSQHFATTRPAADIAAARVLLTLIQVDQLDEFSATVTRARNYQNPVSPAHFAALDGTQERLKRELAFYKISYRFRPESRSLISGLDVMTIEDASVALALLNPDPGFPVTLKREPSKFQDSKSAEYASLFNGQLSGRRLANAVRLYRRASKLLATSEMVAVGLEKLIYRNGRHAIMWLTLRANVGWVDRPTVMTDADAAGLLSQPLDAWRERVRAEVLVDLAVADKGPLAFFRNLTTARPFVVKLRDAGL